MPEILIRPAVPADVRVAGHLLYMTLGPVTDYLFGNGRPNRAEEVLGQLYTLPRNRFSYQHADVAQVGGQVAGLLLSYPGALAMQLDLQTARPLLARCSLGGIMRFLAKAWPLPMIRETEREQYYVSHLAVLPAYQGQGLGRRLLAHAESRARVAGLGQCSLTVGIDNERAYSLYEKVGYRSVQTIETPRLSRRSGLRGILPTLLANTDMGRQSWQKRRMVKVLA